MMQEIIYLTLDQVRDTHKKTIKHSGGGINEILDIGKLEGVLENIQNDEWYPTFTDKLTHLFFCTCQFHCFADGNKRLAITLSVLFLLLNGYLEVAQKFIPKTENVSLNVASGKIDKELLHKIMVAIMNNTYDEDEELKLEIYNAISREL